jgi:hypothetical protein
MHFLFHICHIPPNKPKFPTKTQLTAMYCNIDCNTPTKTQENKRY